MRIAHCPHCRQVIPPRDLFRDQPVKRRIFEYISAHPEGRTRRQVVDHTYAGDPNGGPTFENVISVHIKAMRAVLAREGLSITCARGPGSTYRLEAAP
jgi:hypothetical protein